MTDLRAIEQIMNPATGQWVRFPKPIIVTGGDVDSFIAGYQQRLADEWAEQRAMSDAQLNAIRGRHAAATPGRWYVDPDRGPKWLIRSDEPKRGTVGIMSFTEPTWLQPRPGGANLRFVLNAHRDIAALLAEIDQLRGEQT